MLLQTTHQVYSKVFFEFNKQFTVKKPFHKEIFDNTKERYQKVLNNKTFIQRK